MSQKGYFVASGIIFLLVFILHLLRILNAWDANIGGWQVPMWVSWLAVLVTGSLAWGSYRAIHSPRRK